MKKNFKNLIIIVVSLVVLFYVLAPSLSQKAPAQGPPQRGGPPQSVRIVNQPSNPVPIQGTVEVVNTDPVPVQVMNESAFQPWREWFNLELVAGDPSLMLALPNIPADKRLVIESITAQLHVLKEQIPIISLNTDGVWYNVALSNIGSYTQTQNMWMATHALKLYVKDWGWISCTRAGGTANPFSATVSLSGYLVDLQ